MGYPLDRIELPAGSLLFAEGDSGDAAYLIQSGEIEIFATRKRGDSTLARRGPGDIVGELAVIVRDRRSASARAISDCVLLVVTKSQIDARIANADPILRMCLGIVTDRYLQTAAQLKRVNGARPMARAQPVSQPEFQGAIETLSLDADLRRALSANELVLFFQPIVRLDSRRLVGFEALTRWRHPERGLVPPDHFIPIAEASGFVVDITSWLLHEAAAALPMIREAAMNNLEATDPLFLNINVSGRDLVDTHFESRIAAMLASSGIPASAIKIEVTESTLMKDPIKAAERFEACRKLGVQVAIDDFGTGHSSLGYLSKLPMSAIKIAPSFVHSMTIDATTLKIIDMIVRLARKLGIPVIAEGIEEASEALVLLDMGCTFGQGYLFGRPAPLERTLDLIRRWTACAPKTSLRRKPEFPATTVAGRRAFLAWSGEMLTSPYSA
jgi:diguanylate cyclase